MSALSRFKMAILQGRVAPHKLALRHWPYLAAMLEQRTDSQLQRAAARLTRLRRTGSELAGPCPLCSGRLIVGKLTWRCLGCGLNEVHGDDQAGLDAAYATMRNDSPGKV